VAEHVGIAVDPLATVADLPADQADRQQVGLLMAGKEPA
jgi:hypothetical protein